MCIACEMTGVPACAAAGPCMSLAQQAFHYALLAGAVGLGTMRLFFRRGWDIMVAFMSARYDAADKNEAPPR